MSTPDELSPAKNVSSIPNMEMQQRIAEQQRLVNMALNSTEDFAYVFDRTGRFVFSNQSLLHLLDISLAEIIGKNFFDLHYPPDLATRLQQQIEKVFESHQIVRDETPFVNPAGKSGFYEYIFTPVFAAGGDIEFVIGLTRDISERKRAELERESLVQQLVAERAKLAYLFANAPAFVAMTSGPEHIFELTNPAYLQLIGHRNVVGTKVRVALPEVEGQGFFELLDTVFQTGESFSGKELPIQLQRKPQGPLEERFVDFVYQPILDTEGKVTGIFAHGVDITEQVLARKEAENANRAKDEFLATLSHELRSPLSAIMGWASILQSGQTTPEENAMGLNTIARNARAQHRLIEDILDVSRMIAGKTNLEVQPVDLRVVVEEELNTILPASHTSEVHFQSSFAHGVSAVAGDPARLQQIVRNLLSNALKFTPKGGQVEVSLKRFGEHVEIVVADSGIGMTPEMLPCIFDRFRQADSTSTRAQGGLGLGLAIVQHLIELHGGTIQAHSEGLGKGSTFTVCLPLVAADARANGEGEPANP